MSSASAPALPKTPLQMVLEWSQSRPAWQRDALRRIVGQSALTQSDFDELLLLAKAGQGDASVTLLPVVLDATHLPAQAASNSAISLISLANVAGVNQLAAGQTLPFEPAGITIIYGDNGAGKSGYARILKKACRARFPGTIMPDAFNPSAAAVASATIEFAEQGAAQPPLSWRDDGAGPHPALSAVSVFDRDSASVHLRQENEVAYRPFGLDIPDELAATCNALREELNKEKRALEAAQSPLFASPTWDVNSRVGKVMGSLKVSTDLEPLKALYPLSTDETQRHAQLTADLARNPNTAATEHRLSAEAFKQLADALERFDAANSDAALLELAALSRDARTKREAADISARDAFNGAALDGVGGAVWRVLWDAAQHFAQHAGANGSRFFDGAPGTPCLLCHQPLSDEAAARITSFQQFVAADTERLAKEAEAAFRTKLAAFEAAALATRIIGSHRQRLQLTDVDLARRALSFAAAVRLRRFQTLKGIAADQSPVLAQMTASPVAEIRECELRAHKNADEIAASAQGDVRARLVAEQHDLADRIALPGLLPVAEAEVTRLKSLALVAACISETTTTAVTRLGNDIADTVITPRLRDRFQEEIVQLAADRVRVEVVRAGGRYGSPQYQVRFFANAGASVHNVLSEGEQTCVALAAFLTELATANSPSALVFDDPVTSLDHRWRKKVAERLVKESAVRQIIVLTHDLVFLNDLRTLAASSGATLGLVSLSRGAAGTGVVSKGLPWDGKSVADRVDKLEKDARSAKSFYDAQDDDAYRDAVHRIYSGLRSTWERAIEDVALNGVILRHRDYIDTKHLKKVSALTAADCDAFSAQYKKCCDEIDAHDASRGRNNSPPVPADVLQDVQAPLAWVQDLRTRQGAV